MKDLFLEKKPHNFKMNDSCPEIKPNIKESCFLNFEGKRIGYFLKEIPLDMSNLLKICNNEFTSNRVKKTINTRVFDTGKRKSDGKKVLAKLEQESTIIGYIQKRPHLRLNYENVSSTHRDEQSKDYMRAAVSLCLKSEGLVKKYLPDVYEQQKEVMKTASKRQRLGELYTSSIANSNYAVNFHRDGGNSKSMVNSIFVSRKNTTGGNLFVPAFDACFDQVDGSLLVMPAWLEMHAVTNINNDSRFKKSYRNSFVFYALKTNKGL